MSHLPLNSLAVRSTDPLAVDVDVFHRHGYGLFPAEPVKAMNKATSPRPA
jgi:hypothetical protein